MLWPNLACISNWSLQLFQPDLSCSLSSSVSLTVKLVNASEVGEWNSSALGAESTSAFDRQRKSYLNLTNRSNSPILIHYVATTKSKDFLHEVKETQSTSANFKRYCMLYLRASLRECTVSCDVVTKSVLPRPRSRDGGLPYKTDGVLFVPLRGFKFLDCYRLGC